MLYSIILSTALLGQTPQPQQVVLPERAWVVTSAQARVGTVTRISYRQPVGHTHTCGSCGTTWDHRANASHDCVHCGRRQLIQDRTPRMVTVRTTSPVIPEKMPLGPPRPVSHETQRIIRSVVSPGCANGNCPYVR